MKPINTTTVEEVRRAWVAFAAHLRGKDMQATPEEFITAHYPNLLTQVGKSAFTLILACLTSPETEAEIQHAIDSEEPRTRIKSYVVNKEGRLA